MLIVALTLESVKIFLIPRVGLMDGLRERKKVETRERISTAARQLFFERGYDAVTVVEVAAAAEVSPATVFNYFRTKEHLFFSGLEAFEATLVQTVRDRPLGEPVLAAFRRGVLGPSDRLAAPGVSRGIARAGELIRSSAALQDEERAIRARHADALAAVIAQDVQRTGSEVEARSIASALMAIHGCIVEHARALATKGVTGQALAGDVKRQGAATFDRFAAGLRDYGAKGNAQPERS